MKLCTFKVYPGRKTPDQFKHDKRYYFKVHVYSTEKQMHKAKMELRPEDGPDDGFSAIVMPMVCYRFRKRKGKRGRWVPKDYSLGDALFHRNRLGGGLVAHEALHIALCYLRAVHGSRFKLAAEHNDDTEEELAYVLTTVVRQITIAFYKHKLY